MGPPQSIHTDNNIGSLAMHHLTRNCPRSAVRSLIRGISDGLGRGEPEEGRGEGKHVRENEGGDLRLGNSSSGSNKQAGQGFTYASTASLSL